MLSKKIFTGLLIPSAAMVTETTKKKDDKDKDEGFNCRPSELPIYTPESKRIHVQEIQPVDKKPNFIERSIGKIRMQLFGAIDQARYYKDKTEDLVVDGFAGAQGLYNYLGQDNAETTHKAGAIAVGGLAGLIMGLRGGFIRRTLFTSIGAIGMASVCYPKEAAQYSAAAMQQANNYATIGYNFIYGVKKDDPPLELPKIPTTVSEVWNLVTGSIKEKSVSETTESTEEQVNSVCDKEPEPEPESQFHHDPEPQCNFGGDFSDLSPHGEDEDPTKQTIENPES